MTDNEIIKALECCKHKTYSHCKECVFFGSPSCNLHLATKALDLINRQQAEIERLKTFKSYFDELYGKGLEVANWHENGDLEPFDDFYDSAIREMVGEG